MSEHWSQIRHCHSCIFVRFVHRSNYLHIWVKLFEKKLFEIKCHLLNDQNQDKKYSKIRP